MDVFWNLRDSIALIRVVEGYFLCTVAIVVSVGQDFRGS